MTAHQAQPRTVSTGHLAFVTTLYAMATARLVSADLASLKREDEKALEAVKTPEDSGTLAFFQRAQLASAAAWSPKEPPLYLDVPVKDGAAQPDVLAKWAANAPLALMDPYIGGLRQYRAIAIDVGDQDGLRADAAKLYDALISTEPRTASKCIKELTRAKGRIASENHAIPFFSQNLVFKSAASDSSDDLQR